MKIEKKYLILILILGIALYVRLSFLGMNRLHMDECLYSAYAMRMVDRGDIALNGGLQVDKPPLFFYFLAISFLITKTFSESAARLPNIIFSIITIFYVFKIINILYKNFIMAILSAFFVAFSVYNIAFSVTAFQDVSMTAFFILSLYAVLIDKYFLSAFFYAFSIGCKPMTLFLFPIYLLFLVFFSGKNFFVFKYYWRDLVYGMSCVFVPLVLWSGLLANPRWGIFKFFITQQPEAMNVANNFADRFMIWMDYSKNILNSKIFLYFAIIGLFVVIITDIFKRKEFLKIDLFIFISIFYFFILISFIKFRQFDRYLIPVVPFIAIAMARSTSIITTFLKDEKIKFIFIAIIMGWFYLYVPDAEKLCDGQGVFFKGANGFEDVANYLRLHQNKNSRIIYLGHTLSNYGFFYLYRTEFEYSISVFNLQDIEKNSKSGKNYIIINSHQIKADDLKILNKKYKKVFESGYELAGNKNNFIYQIFEYDK